MANEKQIHELIMGLENFYTSPLMQQELMGTYRETGVLAILMKAKEGLHPSEISKSTHLKPNRIASLLKSLERKGFITRKLDSSDRRQFIIRITPKGQEKYLHDRKRAHEFLCEVIDEFGTHEISQFLTQLNHFQETTNRLLEAGKFSD